MNRTELLDRAASDGEARLLLARVLDKLEQTGRKSVPSHTAFLSPGERVDVERLLAAAGHPRCLFTGGYEGAERTVCVFLPDWQEEEDFLADENGPLTALRCTWREEDTLTHRDLLGALMAQGITREKVGDILVRGSGCDVILLRELEGYLRENFTGAGRVRFLSAVSIPLTQVVPPEGKKELIRDTVAALRLDAVTAAGFRLSRGKAAEAIAAGRVQLNYKECLKSDRTVAAGDVISCRGLGKCRFLESPGASKKGRIIVVLERYL